jgi:hypothetical protein
MRVPAVTLCGLLVATLAEAQPDPMRCWWSTSAGAVAIGETFDATLTCAVREQESTRTVADESRLAAAVVQLAPFEVLGGTHPSDLRSPTHRFFQYHYSLRIIDRDVIGGDAKFPDLQIPYRVHTLANGEWVQGRDRSYVIPGGAVRVLSLVPAAATDIRDSDGAAFGRVADLRFRARALDIAAYALIALSLVVAAPAAVTLMRRRRARAGQSETVARLPRRVLARAVRDELTVIAEESRSGWSTDLVARALSVMRIAAALAAHRDLAVHPADANVDKGGRMLITRGMLRKQTFAVSSAITPTDVNRLAPSIPGPPRQPQLLKDLSVSMTTLSTALYGAAGIAGSMPLDEAFDAGARAIRELLRR